LKLNRLLCDTGLRYPWESALSGVEQCSPSDENHIVGDIALAFRQYWRATQNVTWLKTAGFPVLEGIARYYASRFSLDADGMYHTYGVMGPDEAHGNITDSTYGNAIGAAALTSAYELAALAGRTPNATFKAIAERVFLNYNATGDYHPVRPPIRLTVGILYARVHNDISPLCPAWHGDASVLEIVFVFLTRVGCWAAACVHHAGVQRRAVELAGGTWWPIPDQTGRHCVDVLPASG
jgi:hypothetical protein